jgi:hypothetical protein
MTEHDSVLGIGRKGHFDTAGIAQEPFLRGTALEYAWLDRLPSPATNEDPRSGNEGADHLGCSGSSSAGGFQQKDTDDDWFQHMAPVLQLSCSKVRQELQLIKEGGLLGKGATAYVFKCVWPERFGVKLLAAKVRPDGFCIEACRV